MIISAFPISKLPFLRLSLGCYKHYSVSHRWGMSGSGKKKCVCVCVRESELKPFCLGSQSIYAKECFNFSAGAAVTIFT